ncbi:MAG: hypothetical protein JXA53_08150 [Bacteroidales bacterium]|nr:hypothetical protein [Bacteroidales bacterium]
MKNFKTKKLSKSILLLSVMVITFSSCKKDDPEVNNYIGTWSANQNITQDGVSMDIKDIITLTEDSFIDYAQFLNPSTGKYVDLMKMSGNLSVNSTTMLITIKEIGIAQINPNTGQSSGMFTVKEGDAQFNNLFTQLGISKSYKSEYSVSGNKLTIKTDGNNDGDYTDKNETVIYTRQ